MRSRDHDSELLARRTKVYLSLETVELAATTPLFLWLLSENYGVPEDQVRIGLESIGSWVIRRMLMASAAA